MSYTNITNSFEDSFISFSNLNELSNLPVLVDKSEFIAALACAEITNSENTDHELLDYLFNLAINEYTVSSKYSEEKNNTNILEQIKISLQYFVPNSNNTISEIDEVLRTTRNEVDYDFLRFITSIYTKAYLREAQNFKTAA